MSTIIASLIFTAIYNPTEGWMKTLKIESFCMGRLSAVIDNASCPRLHDLWHALVNADFSYEGERTVGNYQTMANDRFNTGVPEGWHYLSSEYEGAAQSEDLITLAAIGIDAYDFYKWCGLMHDLEFCSNDMRDMLPCRVDCTIDGVVTITKI